MIEVEQNETFRNWLARLKDEKAKARIARLKLGNPGDVKSVGNGVSEMRIDYGPGYRVYFTQRGKRYVILLVGGDKRTQDRDIAEAIKIAAEL